MANPAFESVDPPFTAFKFEVVLNLHEPIAGITNPLCNAAFSECDGLEMTMEPKTVREGGNNTQQFHLVGPVSYGTLSLKRGMTSTIDLWKWFTQSVSGDTRSARGEAVIVMHICALGDRFGTSFSTKRSTVFGSTSRACT